MIRRICLLLCCLLLLWAPLAAARGQGEGYRVIITDEEDLLSENEEMLLRRDMASLTEYGDAAFYSTRRNGMSDVVAEAFFDENISTDRSHSGVVFLIDMYTREITIFTRGLLEKRVGRAGAYAITDNIYRYASQGLYYRCAQEGFAQVLALADGQRIFSPMRMICNLLLALSIGIIAAYLIIRRSSVRRSARQNSMTRTADARIFMDIGAAKLVKRTKTAHSSGGGGGGFHGGGFHSGGGGGFHGGGGGGFHGGGGGGGFHGGGSSGSHGF